MSGQGRGSLRLFMKGNSRQQLASRIGDDDRSVRSFESCHETQVTRRPAHFIPRNPDAVRWPQLRLAEVFGQLLLSEDKLFFRYRHSHFVLSVEGIDDQIAFRLHGLLAILFVKIDASAEATDSRLARFVQHGVRPHGNDLRRHGRLLVFLPRPARCQFPLGATWEQQHECQPCDTQKPRRRRSWMMQHRFTLIPLRHQALLLRSGPRV